MVNVLILLLLLATGAQSSLSEAHQRGQVALQQRRYADAIRAFDEALSLAPPDNLDVLAGLLYYKAAALGGAGDLLTGIAHAKQAVRYAPKEQAYRQLLARLEEEASKSVIPADKISRALKAARSFAAEGSVDLWVNYDFDKDSLSAAGREQATALAEAFKSDAFSKSTFVLIGHTDSQGSDEYNLDLSKRRASRLAEYLVNQQKVPAAQLRVEGRGERELKTTGTTERDHGINRRVEIRLVN
jgi:outer membrane protein OmpA-like peptidoglycan-associated protein